MAHVLEGKNQNWFRPPKKAKSSKGGAHDLKNWRCKLGSKEEGSNSTLLSNGVQIGSYEFGPWILVQSGALVYIYRPPRASPVVLNTCSYKIDRSHIQVFDYFFWSTSPIRLKLGLQIDHRETCW
jgi:hypothetical protein